MISVVSILRGWSLAATHALAFLLCAALWAAPALSQSSLAMERTGSVAFYTPGQTVDLTVTLTPDTSGQINAVGLDETIPSGWTFDSVLSDPAPQVVPQPGVSGTLSFAWFPTPSFPLTFTYRLNVPESSTGTKQVNGAGLILVEGDEVFSPNVRSIFPLLGTGPFHNGDVDLSESFELGELLRIVQFFNLGGLHCADFPGDTEDGFVPGLLGPKACTPHQSDYETQDWRILFSELLRAIQLYNAKRFVACDTDPPSEDGFCIAPE